MLETKFRAAAAFIVSGRRNGTETYACQKEKAPERQNCKPGALSSQKPSREATWPLASGMQHAESPWAWLRLGGGVHPGKVMAEAIVNKPRLPVHWHRRRTCPA